MTTYDQEYQYERADRIDRHNRDALSECENVKVEFQCDKLTARNVDGHIILHKYKAGDICDTKVPCDQCIKYRKMLTRIMWGEE